MGWGEVGVTHGHRYVGVAKEFLNGFQVYPIRNQLNPEILDLGFLHQPPERLPLDLGWSDTALKNKSLFDSRGRSLIVEIRVRICGIHRASSKRDRNIALSWGINGINVCS